MPFDEALGSIKRIDPDNHVFFIKLVWEVKEIPGCFTCLLLMDLLNFLKVLTVGEFVTIVVVDQQLLRYTVLINLVWPNVRIACVHFSDFVFFPDDSSSWPNLS